METEIRSVILAKPSDHAMPYAKHAHAKILHPGSGKNSVPHDPFDGSKEEEEALVKGQMFEYKARYMLFRAR